MDDLREKELDFLRNQAEMRGTCDVCGHCKVMISLHQVINKKWLWLCFNCVVKEKNED
jgi:hypothetical protein